MSFDPRDPSPIHGQSDGPWPSNKQLAAIGSVVLTWSWLQLAIENLMATLVQGDEMLVHSFTEDLSPDNRLNALKRLIKTWERIVLDLNDDHHAAFSTVREVIKWISQEKAKRNRIAHWIWMRTDDKSLFGWKHHTTPRDGDEIGPTQTITVTELLQFGREIGDREAQLAAAERVLRSLPPWPAPPSSLGNSAPPGLASLLSPFRRRG